MEEMKFYFNYTDYQKFLSQNIQERLEYKGYFDIHEESYYAKDQALDEWYNENALNSEILPLSLKNKLIEQNITIPNHF